MILWVRTPASSRVSHDPFLALQWNPSHSFDLISVILTNELARSVEIGRRITR
jgi:hypothetical protein